MHWIDNDGNSFFSTHVLHKHLIIKSGALVWLSSLSLSILIGQRSFWRKNLKVSISLWVSSYLISIFILAIVLPWGSVFTKHLMILLWVGVPYHGSDCSILRLPPFFEGTPFLEHYAENSLAGTKNKLDVRCYI